MKNTLYILFFILCLFSCNTEKREQTNTLCDNQKYLLAPNKDLPTFIFDLNINPKEHIEILKDSLKNNLLDHPNMFNWQYKDRIIKIDLIPIHLMYCGVSRHEISIILNINNQMLFESELKETNNLVDLVNTSYLSKTTKGTHINIDSYYGLSKPIINNVVYDVSEGYLKAMEIQSNKLYKKSICELSKDEIISLQEDNQILIYFQSFLDQIEEDRRLYEIINSN